jgi:preprotein translocase subunit YajC
VPAELQLLVIVIALLGFWAIVMRPARVQQRQVAQLQAGLEVGDEVIISAGIFGTIVAIEDDRVRLQIAPGTVITAARQVVVRRAPEPETEAPDGAAPNDAAPDNAAPDSKPEED